MLCNHIDVNVFRSIDIYKTPFGVYNKNKKQWKLGLGGFFVAPNMGC